MKYDPQKHNRRSFRLQGYDYGQPGAYFITIVAQARECLFGEIHAEEMILNDAGKMVIRVWETMPMRFLHIELGAAAVMPNHFHGIVVIHESVGPTLSISHDLISECVITQNRAGTSPAPTRPTLGEIIGTFKSLTTHEYIKGVETLGWPPFNKHIWQRNYYEHVIRDAENWNKIHLYIKANPAQWGKDEENPRRGDPCGRP